MNITKMGCSRVMLVAVCMVSSLAMSEPKPDAKSPAAVMRELRLRWLTEWSMAKPKGEESGQPPQPGKISAVLMDWPIHDQVATVLASSGGDASLYTTAGFGIIGGIGHENVRKAAIALTDISEKYLAHATPTTDYSYATAGQIKFFFVLPSGVRSLISTTAQVEQSDSPERDLFIHAQQVVTELRSITPQGAQK